MHRVMCCKPFRDGCCGNGVVTATEHVLRRWGGGLWMENLKGERLSDLGSKRRWPPARSVLATACPYCITMFEDSGRTLNVDDQIKIKDVTELLLESLEINIDEPVVATCSV